LAFRNRKQKVKKRRGRRGKNTERVIWDSVEGDQEKEKNPPTRHKKKQNLEEKNASKYFKRETKERGEAKGTGKKKVWVSIHSSMMEGSNVGLG